LKGSENGFFVVAEMLGEICQQTSGSRISPAEPRSGVPLPDDAAELACQRCACGDLRGPSVQFIQSIHPGKYTVDFGATELRSYFAFSAA
jgi:hypothetical protein